MQYKYLFDLALILLSTKVLGLFSQRFRLPHVVGALIAGLLLGPAVLGIIQETDFLKTTANLGVIVLMFTSGMETDIHELKKSGKAAFVIALIGVLLPLAGGFAVGCYFNNPELLVNNSAGPEGSLFLQNIFLGIILTATSVSITVETLRELGKLRSPAGSAILGAAIIDDVLGIIALTIVTSFSDESVNVAWVLIKIVLFFVFALAAGVGFSRFYRWWTCKTDENRTQHVIVAFAFCLLFSFVAEVIFGVADITGAFVAGLVLSNTSSEKRSQYLASNFETISFLYLSPVFFASIGLQVELTGMNTHILLFAVALTIVAILSKILGCGLGAKLCRYTNQESLQIGVGMISRGEVALIVATKGADLGLISKELFGPVIVVVVVTTIITPILLKLVFHGKDEQVPAET
ncbi:cation:proton antiporter [Evtepia sp.]|uniref:cation:proton antiporter n=1 Tax=Evtepia sp. TaxID=2773933 RepID=UPI002A8298B2|nr:cation:proton antiporter [Evtepia sp.]MDY3993807.1 cation:proton antiporter [Evtepia sp.]MDY4429858.1 cation:proton antiporter [Evtepia sp.]